MARQPLPQRPRQALPVSIARSAMDPIAALTRQPSSWLGCQTPDRLNLGLRLRLGWLATSIQQFDNSSWDQLSGRLNGWKAWSTSIEQTALDFFSG
jgi:hypothetical protein